MLMDFGQDYDTPPSDDVSSGGGITDFFTAISTIAPQVTQTVSALRPLWGGTAPATGYTQSTTPRPPPVQQASALSGNLPLILGGAAVLGLGILLMKRR